MAWLEASALGHAMRESGVWTYGLVNLVHILGVSSLFGALVVLDLRLTGLWRSVSLAAISQPTERVAAAGFAIAAISGVSLLATKATEYAGNPFLLIKFSAIGVGLLNVLVLRSLTAWREHPVRELTSRERSRLAVAGMISLVSWLTAIAAGRMIAYW
jgi:hypothetical protein